MSLESPKRIAIIGGGPLGIEAALYARYLGYDVMVFEREQVGERLLRAQSEPLPTPAGKNRTTLGIAALQAQGASFHLPLSSQTETAGEFLESYLIPLASSDLLANSICTLQTVIRVERSELEEEGEADCGTMEETEESSDEDEFEIEYAPFLLTVKQADESEVTSLAEIVIDASGLSVYSNYEADAQLREMCEIIPSGLANPLLAGKHPVRRYMTEEPNFYRLGISDSDDSSPISIPTGHDQIRQIFTAIGERESLNLYETFRSK